MRFVDSRQERVTWCTFPVQHCKLERKFYKSTSITLETILNGHECSLDDCKSLKSIYPCFETVDESDVPGFSWEHNCWTFVRLWFTVIILYVEIKLFGFSV